MNTYRPLNEKFQNNPILTKIAHSFWGFRKSQILTKRPYYRPWFVGEMFKRTQ